MLSAGGQDVLGLPRRPTGSEMRGERKLALSGTRPSATPEGRGNTEPLASGAGWEGVPQAAAGVRVKCHAAVGVWGCGVSVGRGGTPVQTALPPSVDQPSGHLMVLSARGHRPVPRGARTPARGRSRGTAAGQCPGSPHALAVTPQLCPGTCPGGAGRPRVTWVRWARWRAGHGRAAHRRGPGVASLGPL